MTKIANILLAFVLFVPIAAVLLDQAARVSG